MEQETAPRPSEEDQPANVVCPSSAPTRATLQDEHRLSVAQVAARHGTSVDEHDPGRSFGLCVAEARARLARDGANAISPPKKASAWRVFLKHLMGLFNVLLIVSGTLSLILFAIDPSSLVNVYLGAILFLVAWMNAFIDFYQQHQTAAILESFLSLVPPEAAVLREQAIRIVPAADIVVGDVVLVRSGDRVPADIRLFHTTDLKVDNSSITGESEGQERSHADTHVSNVLEAANIAFSGTTVVNGEGYGIAIRTGDRSVLGQIACLTIGEHTPHSQLTVEIELFVRKIACVAILTAVVFFVVGILLGYSVGITFSFAIGIFVAYVPQGLPVTVSTLLTIAAKRMARRNVLVKNLHAVETLGAITLLATDKTGTLTQNKMTVVGAWINEAFFAVATGGDISHEKNAQASSDLAQTNSDPAQKNSDPAQKNSNPAQTNSNLAHDTPNLPALISACALCTKSKFDASEDGMPLDERRILGDSTEVALLRFSCRFIDAPAEQQRHPKAFEVPFNSETKWHLTVHKIAQPHSHYTAFVKGAPERIVRMCSHIQTNDQIAPWNSDTERAFAAAYEQFAVHGRRVLALAHQILPSQLFPEDHLFVRDQQPVPMASFVFLGLLAIMDPPKHGVRKAIAACRTAGVQIVMVTGDHPLTAEAIARQIGLVSGDTIVEAAYRLHKPVELVEEDDYDAIVVHGEKLAGLAEADWDRILSKKEIVFARTSPKNKLEIVTRFQNKGHIVGVSGDGVNDSPALKKADLGISMNKTASDVSKEAAAMILLDDNFPSIVYGIAEGRLIFANLKKSIRYTLTHITPEVAAFLAFIILAIPTPINSLLLLLIDLGSELGPALSFAFEPPENDLMLVPPRKVLCQPKPRKKDQQDVAPDLEAPKTSRPSWARAMWHRCSKFFSRVDTGEVLVDTDLLFWAYCQGGVIESIGCFGAYLAVLALYRVPLHKLIGSAKTYWTEGAPTLTLTDGTIADAAAQIAISGSSQSAYYLGVVICQLFNLWVTKHRYSYPYGWDMLRNTKTYIGAGIAVIFAAIVVYVPGLDNVILGGGPVPPIVLLIPIMAGVFLIFYEFVRRFLRKKGLFGGNPKTNLNLLDLVRTTSSVKQ